MDIQQIKNQLFSIKNKSIKTIKEILKYPFAKRYILLALVSTLFFIIITFPFDVLIINNLNKLEGRTIKKIDVGNLDFSLFGSSYIDNLNITLKKNKEVNLQNINLDPEIFSILNKNLVTGLEIENITYKTKDELYKGKIIIDSDLSLNNNDIPENGTFNIDIFNLVVKGLKIKGFNIQTIRANNLKVETEIIDKIMSIKKFVLKSKDLSAKVLGKIIFNEKSIGKSNLNLKVEIDSNSAILENYKMLLGSVTNQSNNKINISIKGTIDRPKFDLPFGNL